MKQVYLAGPDVFFDNPMERIKPVRRLCEKHGLKAVFPLDAVVPVAREKRKTAERIFQANLTLIQSSDAVLANMMPFRGASMDAGTIWEMGCGYGFDKLVAGYTDHELNYKERVNHMMAQGELAVDTYEVEDFEQADNLMITCGAHVFATAEEAVVWLAKELGR